MFIKIILLHTKLEQTNMICFSSKAPANNVKTCKFEKYYKQNPRKMLKFKDGCKNCRQIFFFFYYMHNSITLYEGLQAKISLMALCHYCHMKNLPNNIVSLLDQLTDYKSMEERGIETTKNLYL